MFTWLRRITGLLLVLAAAGGVVSFAPAPGPGTGVGPVAAAPSRPVPPARPIAVDPMQVIVYQRGYEPHPGQRVLVERWAIPGIAFRERITVDGVVAADRSDGREVDYRRGVWRTGTARELDGGCARTPEEVQAGLADGTVTESGPGEPVAGHDTTVLRHHGTPAVDLWVLSGTHRPIRCRVAGRDSVTFDLVWLPASEANLALLVAVIPDGFTGVALGRETVTDRS